MDEETKFGIRMFTLTIMATFGAVILCIGWEKDIFWLMLLGLVLTFFGFVHFGRELEKSNIVIKIGE